MEPGQLNPLFIAPLNSNSYFFFSYDIMTEAYCDNSKLNIAKREFAFGGCAKLAVKFERGWENITFTYVEFKNVVDY